MITDVEDYFTKGCGRCERFETPDCSTRRWIKGLNTLRALCRGAALEETVKWAHPVYMHDERNIAMMGAFRDDFRLTFFNAALMKDPQGVLEKAGPNAQHASMIRFTDNDAPSLMADLIRSYLDEAIGYARAGIKPEKVAVSYELPSELVDAMDSDPELAEAFHELTPGRQKSYVFDLNRLKKSSSRVARIAKVRDHILAGKGALER